MNTLRSEMTTNNYDINRIADANHFEFSPFISFTHTHSTHTQTLHIAQSDPFYMEYSLFKKKNVDFSDILF